VTDLLGIFRFDGIPSDNFSIGFCEWVVEVILVKSGMKMRVLTRWPPHPFGGVTTAISKNLVMDESWLTLESRDCLHDTIRYSKDIFMWQMPSVSKNIWCRVRDFSESGPSGRGVFVLSWLSALASALHCFSR